MATLTSESSVVAGIDEAGRGSWAGPVVAAAVVLPRHFSAKGIRDSKLLTPLQRERLFAKITSACPYAVGVVSNRTIDRIGIKAATQRAMRAALRHLPIRPTQLLIDGQDGFSFDVPSTSIIRGDQTVKCISAASIVAKVYRDRLMVRLDRRYPAYGLAQNKGYGTAQHHAAILHEGPCALHRMSFAPLRLG